MGAPEKALESRVLRRLGRRGDILLWKNETGLARSIDGQRIIKFGTPGSPDLLGVRRVEITADMVGMTIGQALGLEIKPGRTRQSDQQENFEAAFARRGGLYLLVRSEDDIACLDDAPVLISG